MRSRLRTGAAAAIALGALLLATVLASPALAWHSNVTVDTKCLDNGKVGVHYTVTSWEAGHEATVHVSYKLDNGEGGELPTGHFGKEADESSFEGEFELPPEGSATTVTVIAVAKWTDDQESTNKGSAKLPEEKCKGGEESSTSTSKSTTSTSESTTTTTPSSSETSAPTTSIEETTTTAEVGAATSTTAGGGQLPFTGANSGPMLLAGIVLVAGGSLFLLLTRSKDGHATK
jgi:LPXTG-motif cell wall-anchored protein